MASLAIAPFTPLFVFESELQQYGLPSAAAQTDIMNIVALASIAIDEFCGRIDGDGNGSLVYSTYEERILMQTRNRNLIQLAQKPLVGLTSAEVALLQASGSAQTGSNPYYTGALAGTVNNPFGNISAIISCSGRYSYPRQDQSYAYPDLSQMINPLSLITLFGGPAPWVSIDNSACDYDPRTGEVWVPAGIQLQRYSEVDFTYTSGFNPLALPGTIKQACTALVKNALARGGGTTGLLNISVPRSASFSFGKELIDPTVARMLTPFCTVRAA